MGATVSKWVKHWNENTKNILSDINRIIVQGSMPGADQPDGEKTIPPYLKPPQDPAPVEADTPQSFRDQTMSMVGQPVLRGRQYLPGSTHYTAGRRPKNPKNRKYGNRVTLLTG